MAILSGMLLVVTIILRFKTRTIQVSWSMAAQDINRALQVINNPEKEEEEKKKAIGEKRQNDKAYYIT